VQQERFAALPEAHRSTVGEGHDRPNGSRWFDLHEPRAELETLRGAPKSSIGQEHVEYFVDLRMLESELLWRVVVLQVHPPGRHRRGERAVSSAVDARLNLGFSESQRSERVLIEEDNDPRGAWMSEGTERRVGVCVRGHRGCVRIADRDDCAPSLVGHHDS
jgi:hypothetical protein